MRMARQATTRFEKKLAALSGPWLHPGLRGRDILKRLTAGQQQLSERANLDVLEPLRVIQVGDLYLFAFDVMRRERLFHMVQMLVVQEELRHPCGRSEVGWFANPTVNPIEIHFGI